MSWEIIPYLYSLTAGATITTNRAVTVDSTGKAVHPASADVASVGIARESVASGKPVDVQDAGICMVEASAAITAPALVAVSGSDGRIATATPQDPTATPNFHYAVGVALAGASGAGALVPVKLSFIVYVNTTAGI